jgi:rubrerythrin
VTKKKIKKRPAMDKQSAFIEFKKEDDGKNLEESIRDNRNELKTMKTKLKDLTEKCNQTKKTIDLVKGDLDKKQDDRRANQQHHMAGQDEEELLDEDDGPQEIIDEDELALLQRLKELKKDYRNCFNNLKSVK